jgi:uncharacterized protein (TIGR00725 family)
MDTTIAVFGASRSVPGDPHYQEGVRCGRLLAEAGFVVATGGYGGTMEAVSRGARDAGGHVIGVTAPTVFPRRGTPNAHVTTETRAASLMDRISELAEGTDAAIALWGSLGTATELLAVWNLAFVASFSDRERKPILAVGQPWTTVIPMLESTLDTESGLVTVVASVEEAVAALEPLARTGP